MRIIRYHNSPPVFNPAANFSSLREEMDRLFNALQQGSAKSNREEFPIDLFRDKNAFVVRAELPGFRKEDLNLEVADGVLTITGHRKAETNGAEQKENASAQAVPERRVSRSIPLPEQVKVDAIEAKYENGVLTVTLPKQEEAKPRQIAVDVK